MNSSVKRLGGNRIDRIGFAGHREEHAQHVRAVVEIVARIDEWLAEGVLMAAAAMVGSFATMPMREDLPVRGLWMSVES